MSEMTQPAKQPHGAYEDVAKLTAALGLVIFERTPRGELRFCPHRRTGSRTSFQMSRRVPLFRSWKRSRHLTRSFRRRKPSGVAGPGRPRRNLCQIYGRKCKLPARNYIFAPTL